VYRYCGLKTVNFGRKVILTKYEFLVILRSVVLGHLVNRLVGQSVGQLVGRWVDQSVDWLLIFTNSGDFHGSPLAICSSVEGA
jgi:hypothetical protein